ncbi:maltose acetyltransferase domain-containing protein [Polymorphospora sp. NPDC051019]|uniref:maltose acetyltransferase domain-containing protein n=1 Tax=Polymorphospora sp. NPDC051019 TaxID=3155725 RepID=UPI00341936CE
MGTRRVDPERRDRIIDAALALIAEEGVAGISHRKVARRADVPLGSMTYHFEGMGELLREAFTRFAGTVSARFEERLATARDADEARAAVADFVHHDDPGNPRELVLTHELYTLAAREPAYRELTRAWMGRSREILERHFDPATARQLDALVEGLTIHRALDTTPADRALTVDAIARITAAPVARRPDGPEPAGLEALRTRMLSGRMYDDTARELVEARRRTVLLTDEYNASFGRPPADRERILRRLLAAVGRDCHFEPTFRCEFGFNIRIGDNFYANFDCVLLDGGGITIGDDVLFGPRVGVYTSNHAIDAAERAAGACYAKPVVIGDRVWIGGDVTVNQGVIIGAGSIVGSGSVVTKSVPAGVVAAGNPARVLREITDADRTGFRP